MRAGLFNEEIKLFKKVNKVSEFGKETFGFDRIFNQKFYSSKEWKKVRAKVEHKSETRILESESIVFPIVKIFHIRYFHEVEESMRVFYQGKFYQITSITGIRERGGEKILTTEVVYD